MEKDVKLSDFNKKTQFFKDFSVKNTIFWVKINKKTTTKQKIDKKCVKPVNFIRFFAKQIGLDFQWGEKEFFKVKI